MKCLNQAAFATLAGTARGEFEKVASMAYQVYNPDPSPNPSANSSPSQAPISEEMVAAVPRVQDGRDLRQVLQSIQKCGLACPVRKGDLEGTGSVGDAESLSGAQDRTRNRIPIESLPGGLKRVDALLQRACRTKTGTRLGLYRPFRCCARKLTLIRGRI